MILIDKPYASPFLIDTLVRNRWPVIQTKIAQEMVGNQKVNWIDEERATALLQNHPQKRLYSNSENALDWVEKNLPETDFNKYAKIFKDKYRFREVLKNIYPDFKFLKADLNQLKNLQEDNLPFPFVIKPSVGFFSIGVHIVRTPKEWKEVKNKLLQTNFDGLFPKNVLDTSHFIIEELIEGEEFAVDFYFDEDGQAVILNITKHLFASETDTSDRVYTTSKEIITQHIKPFTDFLNKLGKITGIKNFPAHAEIRINNKGQILPIEINPLRFGGWSTTAEILGLGTDFNPYEAYFNRQKPDWDKIFEGKENKMYSIVILDNNSGIPSEQIHSFDYGKLAADFENPIEIRKFNIKNDPIFGFVFAETSKENIRELYNILQSDLKKYIIL
jgi:hypothetical protein